MKRKIYFIITIGGEFGQNKFFPSVAIGGERHDLEFEFETDNVNSMKDAEKALYDEVIKKFNRDDYFIWYWYWLPNDTSMEDIRWD